jgi:hypothetical protein
MTISIAKSIALASLASSNIEVSRATSAEVAIPIYFDGSGANIFMQKDGLVAFTSLDPDHSDRKNYASRRKTRFSFISESEVSTRVESVVYRLPLVPKAPLVAQVGAIASIRNPIDATKGKLVLGSMQESFESSCEPGSILSRNVPAGDYGRSIPVQIVDEVYYIDSFPFARADTGRLSDTNVVATMPLWMTKPIFVRMQELGATGSLLGFPGKETPMHIRRNFPGYSWTVFQLPVMENCSVGIIEKLPPIRVQFNDDASSFVEIEARDYVQFDAERNTCKVLVKHDFEGNVKLNIWRLPTLNMRVSQDGLQQVCRASSSEYSLAPGSGLLRLDYDSDVPQQSVAGEGVSVSAGPGISSTTTVLPSEEENTTLLA